MDIRASGTKRPAGPLPPLTWSSCPPPLRLDSPSFQHRQPYSPTAGSSHWKHGRACGPSLFLAMDSGLAGSNLLLRAQPEPPGWAQAGSPAQLPCFGPQEGVSSPVPTSPRPMA